MFALIACSATVGDPAGSAGSGDIGSTETGAAPEEIPGSTPGELGPDTEGLCQLALVCDTPPAFDTRVPCTFRVAAEDGRVDWDGDAEVWIRGRSSSQVAKPGYGVELAETADLLRMGGERDWVIDGLYYDRLLVRDKLGYDLFADMGNPAPESSLCEMTINGSYFGVHALVERIEQDDDRIDIVDGAESGLAFVLTQNDDGCFYTNTTTYGCWKLISPDDAQLSHDGAVAMTEFLAGWETGIFAGEPVENYVDLGSVLDTVILEEFFKNEDAFYTSMHLWKDEPGLIHFEPWDLDMTFGQFPYYPYGDYGNAEIWIDYRPTMWTWVANDPAFRDRLVARWAELRGNLLANDEVYARVDHLEGILGDAIARNDEVWPIETINYGGWFYEVSSYADEDAHVKAWIETRLAWMDANIAGY